MDDIRSCKDASEMIETKRRIEMNLKSPNRAIILNQSVRDNVLWKRKRKNRNVLFEKRKENYLEQNQVLAFDLS